MTRRNLLIGVLVALICGVCGWWFYNNFAYVDKELRRGYRGEARANQLLAAEFFLRQMGVEAQSIEGPQQLDQLSDAQAALIITTERTTLSESRSQRLLEWVEQGGHLILHPRRYIPGVAAALDPLLSPFGVQGGYVPYDEEEKDQDEPKSEAGECPAPTRFVPMPGSEDLLAIDFSERLILETERTDQLWEYADDQGYRGLGFAYGQGRVTILSDLSFFYNYEIGKYDHAQFLYWLVQGQPGAVWIMHSDDLPPLWLWIWRRAPAIVVTAGLLLLFWLLLAPRRFGPLLPPMQARRRRIMEHVEVSGHYLWKHGHGGVLLNGLREALLIRLHQVRPDLAGLSADQLATRLADITGIGANMIKQALIETSITNRDIFTRQIQILETIRKQL